MLQRLATVALNAYREAVRARILLGLAGVAFAVAGYSLVVGAFTLNDAPRVVADLGAATVSIFSIAVAVLIGAQSLYRELEMKTILPLLARPIRRWEYLLGKYLGIILVVSVFILAESGLVLMMSAVMGGAAVPLTVGVFIGLLVAMMGSMLWSPWARTFAPIPWALAMFAAGVWLCGVAPLERSLIVSSSILTLLEVVVIAAIAMLFASFSTPFLSSLLTVGSFVVGRNADALASLPQKAFGETMHQAGKVLSAMVPNLHLYVPARPLLTGEAVDTNLLAYLAMAGVQALAWSVGLLVVASLVFQRRDFV